MNIEIELKFPTGSGGSKSVQALAKALEGREVELTVTCNHMEIAKQYKGELDNLNCNVRRLMGANLRLPDLLTVVAVKARDHVAVLHEVNIICQRMHDLEQMTASTLSVLNEAAPVFSRKDCIVDTYSEGGGNPWVPAATVVRVRHVPTGLSTASSGLISQYANREAAFQHLEKRVTLTYSLQQKDLAKPNLAICNQMTRRAYGDLMTAAQVKAAQWVIAEAQLNG